MIRLLSKGVFCVLMACLFCLNLNAQNYPANSPVAINGKLKVSGTQLVNECGNAVQLRGMSTHGPQWFGQCYNKSAISTLVKDWGISVFRWAMYVEENGYITNPSGFRSKIDEMVDICGELGIYCLIDWHVLTPGDPNAHKTEALEFWKYMSQKHGNKAHVLYEICNEPNKVEWGTVKNYANDVIKAIRDNNDQTVIIVGTPTWSQDVDVAGASKLNGTNIMYTLHFYAGTHKDYLRQKAQTALNNNTPIFVTEFGTSDASGDNAYSPDETKTWINWLNERKISWICWSFSDHREVSAALVPGSCSGSNWNNVSTTGQLIKGLISANKIPYIACNGQQSGNNDNNNQQNQNNNNQNQNNWQDPNQNQNNNNNNQQPDNNNTQSYPANSPVAMNGKLKVSGTQLVNACGEPVQLRGMSTHGPQWFGQCYNKSAVSTLVKDWGISVFRWAMYVEENGYITNPSGFRSKIDEMVDICGELGIYCLIDWHVLTPGDPNAHKTEALEFWKYMSQKHGNKAHVLYEICNEPNRVDWGTVKNYANDVIKAIRDNNDNTVIIVGTTNWSQDVDVAGASKLSGNNLMYTLHFYAGTHKDALRQKAQTALNNNTPIFVTEFGTSDASGDNAYSPDETKTWINWLNERKISWICWSFSDHKEVSAALVPGSCSGSNWNNVSTTGQLIKGLISANKIPFIACNGQQSGDNNNNNNNQNNNQQDQNQNQNNNNNQQDQNQNNNNNNNNQQQEEPVTYPSLVQEITNKDVYRIVNKKSGKVMSIADGSDLKQVKRDENDQNQLFRLKEVDGYYFIQKGESKIMLSNKYVNNDGTKISLEELSNYDNPSQKWSIKKVNDWFMISNKTDQSGSKVLAVENASKQDNANVVIFSKNNQDEQLWGLEYVYTPDPSSVEDVISMDISAPTVIEDEFHITTSTGEGVIVDIYTVTGINVKHFGDECTYNVSDLARGNYIVVVSRSNGQRILSQLIIKK